MEFEVEPDTSEPSLSGPSVAGAGDAGAGDGAIDGVTRLDEQSVPDLEPPLPDDARGAEVPAYLSPSSASMFQQCPRKWKHRYLDRMPDPPGEPALAGTFAHRVLELLLQRSPAERTVEAAKTLAREVWPETEADPDFVALALDDDAQRAFRWRAWQAIEGLWRIEDPTEVTVEATEQDIQIAVDGVPFRGIIDRVDREDDGLVVADYKSGQAPSPRFADARLAQVLLYAAALTELHGRRPVRARLLYLNQRIIEIDVTEDNIAASVATLRTTWEQLIDACAREAFEASTGPLCAWCPFVAHCPEGQAEVEQRHLAGRVRTDAPALSVMALAG